VLTVARLAADIIVFQVQGVAHVFPGVAHGVLELFPRALDRPAELVPAILRVALQLVPAIVGIVTLVNSQVIAIAVGRIVVVEVATGAAVVGLPVVAERRAKSGVVVLGVEGVLHIFPAAADGVLEVVPRTAQPIVGAALPVAAGLSLQLFPRLILVPMLVARQGVAVAISRAVPVIVAAAAAIGRLVMLPVTGLEVGIIGFHIQRVLQLFPAFAHSVLELFPRALRSILAALPGTAGIGFHLVPGVVAAIALVAGQGVTKAVGRVILGEVAAGRAIGRLVVLAEGGRIGGVVKVAAIAFLIDFDVVVSPGSSVGIVARPTAGSPVLGATLHIHRAVVVHHVHGLLGAFVLDLQADEDTAAAHTLGVQLGLVLRHAPTDQRANETADGRANARPGQPSHQRPGRQHRPEAGNGQHTQPQQHAGQAADDAAGHCACGHVAGHRLAVGGRRGPRRVGHGQAVSVADRRADVAGRRVHFLSPAVGGHQTDVGAVETGLHQVVDGGLGIIHIVVESNNRFHVLILLLSIR